ncbi:hypothetical protein IJG20_02195 [Candidatus Saccharibacteria bacterium]|nr:hypothetical protein [Candidatus Saccharibacteria bacterium]
MTAEQQKQIEESPINKALVLAYFSFKEFLKTTGSEVEEKTIRFESAKPTEGDKWEIVLSYSLKSDAEPKTAFEALEFSRRRKKLFVVNPEENKVLSVSEIE